MSGSARELETLRREAGRNGGALRFKQGDSPAVDAFTLVDSIHTLFGISLVEPIRVDLVWNDTLGRRWACDCVEHAMPAAAAAVKDEDFIATLEGAIHTAREYLEGESDLGTLDAKCTELFVEEWPTHVGPFSQLVKATQQATARDLREVTYPTVGIVFAGKWAATAAREARGAVADPEAERRWQAERLLDYLLLGNGDGPVG